MERRIEGVTIVNSDIAAGAAVEPFSHIIDSTISATARIYKGSWIVKSVLKDYTFAGDGTKLDHVQMADFARVGKLNHLYHAALGRHTYTGQDTVIMHTQIGAFSSISWGVTIGAGEHDFSRVTSHSFLYNRYDRLNDGEEFYNRFEKDCAIGSDVWIGANATILRGVEVGDGAVIGANAIVTKSVPPYAIVAGNPAKTIKYRFPQDIIDRLLALQWWNLEDELIRSHCGQFSKYPDHRTLDEIEKLVQQQRGILT